MHSQQPRPGIGWTRREVLRAGSLFPFGVGLLDVLAPRASAARKGRAKSVILLFMWGGPSHLDTWDPKPTAPQDIRGLFQSIPTTVPELRIGEYFPLLAARAGQYAVVRSMTHTDPAHLSPVHHLFTGHIAAKPNSDDDPARRTDAPCLGAVVQKVLPSAGAVPAAVALPWAVSHPAAPGGVAPGQHGGWLGTGFDPFLVTGNPNSPEFAVAGLTAPADVASSRLQGRAALLRRLEQTAEPRGGYSTLQSRALDLLLAPTTARAFDLSRETPALRDRYGRHPHGQSCLLARRLIEAGSRLVTVNWPDDGQTFWDTHGKNFPSLKDRLMPPADRAFSALLDDLSARGLLDETLVVWVGEFGRTPRVEKGGRQHWPHCYSAVLAGGGIQGGVVYGGSDKHGAYPADRPVSPADLTATVYHALGIDPATEIHDPTGRPWKLADGTPLRALFS
jgi:uncharacterized protein (DUF1501 family)